MNADWAMVFITIIYVVATIVICWANIKSANASKAQLEEMMRQYADANRPEIEVELHYLQRTWYIARFVNHGSKTAQHVKICLEQEFIDSLPEEPFRKALKQIQGKECIIGAGQHYDLFIGSNGLRGNPSMKPMAGYMEYESQGNKYKSDFCVDLEHYMTFFSSTTDEEKMLKSLKTIGTELKGIKEALHAMGIEHEDCKENDS